VVRAGSVGLGENQVSGARGGYVDNARINRSIFFDNNVERIDVTNFRLLNMSVSVVVVELCMRRQSHGEWPLGGVTTRVLPAKCSNQ
jgi:hypothetical protein